MNNGCYGPGQGHLRPPLYAWAKLVQYMCFAGVLNPIILVRIPPT